MSAFHPEDMTPAAALLGRRVLEIDPVTGRVRVGFTARPEFLNRHGTVQGGFLAAMLDSATAIAALVTLPEGNTVVTTELVVRYVRPATAGDVTAVGRLLEHSGRDARAEGERVDASGQVVARAAATLRVVHR